MKKQTIILRGKSYSILRTEDYNFSILATFLVDDVCVPSGFYRRWAQNDEERETSGNRSDLEKVDNKIFIRDLYATELGRKGEESFVIIKDNFVSVLNQWEKINKTKPAKVTIVKINGKIMLESSDFLTKEEKFLKQKCEG